MKRANKILSKCVLLERALLQASEELNEELKSKYPALANVVRNDFRAINRSHEYFFKTVQPILKNEFLEDYEKLDKLLSNFFDIE